MVFLLSPLESHSISSDFLQAVSSPAGTEEKGVIASVASSLPESEAIKDEAIEEIHY